jgi:hypothetical protein
LDVKINLKIKQKSVDKRDMNEDFEGRLYKKLNLNEGSLVKSKLLPEIKNNSRGMRYQLNIRHQKYNLHLYRPSQLISIIGETKELVRNSKVILHN